QHQEKWLERAKALHIDELILEVRLAKPGSAPRDRDDRKGLPEIRLKVQAELPPVVYAKWEQAQKKIRDEAGREGEAWEGIESLCDLALASDADALDSGASPSYCVVLNDDGGKVTVDTEDGPIPVDDVTAETIACDCGCMGPGADHDADRRVPIPLRRRVFS